MLRSLPKITFISFPKAPFTKEPVVVEAEAYYEDLGQV